ncbi:MAG: HPr family phosphocarrier protein [Hyphomonadaceae bacterium]|nr:HPr family phosphocarrier protein [Hyphomonadaceae bacterium]
MADCDTEDPARQSVTIVNAKGLHARASAALSKLAGEFDARVTVHHRDVSADARSIMDLLMLVASKGCEIEITASGPQAVEAVTALASLVANGFGEGDSATV